MRILTAVAAAAFLLAVGCATTDPGWEGAGATPFDSADADCAKAAGGRAGDAATAYEQCMARHGWTRGQED